MSFSTKRHNAEREKTMKTAIFTCKPTTLKDLHNPYAMKSSDARPYTVTETITMTTAKYDAFGNWLLESRPEFAGKGGSTPKGVTTCIAIEAQGRRMLLVNPEGYDYAREVAFA